MRLIDADELLKTLNENNAPYREDINRAIIYAPTIYPVRHGRWVRDETDKWRCSACGAGNNYAYEWSVGGEKLQDNYCPKCGAKMDADADADGKR